MNKLKKKNLKNANEITEKPLKLKKEKQRIE